MTSIYFVRHAHSEYTPDEYGRELSKKGREDATLVTKVLQKEKIDVVLSSPYKRAIQTVKGIAEQRGLDVQIIEALKERLLARQSVNDFEGAINKVWSQPDFSFEGGESNHDAQQRVISQIVEQLKVQNGKQIVIGTHGNIMVLMMHYFDPSFDFEFWKRLTMPDIYKLTFSKEQLIEVQRVWEK